MKRKRSRVKGVKITTSAREEKRRRRRGKTDWMLPKAGRKYHPQEGPEAAAPAWLVAGRKLRTSGMGGEYCCREKKASQLSSNERRESYIFRRKYRRKKEKKTGKKSIERRKETHYLKTHALYIL